MTDIRKKARVLLNAAREAHVNPDDYLIGQTAVCLAIEQHEAFRQAVSDAVEGYLDGPPIERHLIIDTLRNFIIPKPKPDPLAGVLEEVFSVSAVSGRINAALEARGLEIREKGQ